MLIGRRAPLDRIGRLLDAARQGQAGALVLVGEAGIGKTALLDAAEGAADGFRVLRARGVESEAAFGPAGLLQLLGPVRDRRDDVPPAQRAALDAALGWGAPGGEGDRYLVAAGALSLLAAAAEASPLLVLVDDLHWLDAGSAAAVLFAARRLTHDRVAVLLATRGGAPAGVALDGLDRFELSGLAPADATGLLPAGTAPAVAARLAAATHGNPLALMEAAVRLSPAQRRGAAELPDPLPAGERLRAVYEPVLAALSPPGRRAVLLVAAARDDAAEPVLAALRADGPDPEAPLAEAESGGVLVRAPGTLRFRHPLLRTTAWAAAAPAERRAAHAGLAAVVADGRARTWHRAEAAVGADADLAAALEATAQDDRERSGHAAASAALERAARLSDDPALARRRLAGAVEEAALAGDATRARTLADDLLAGDADERTRGRVLASLGVLEQATGSVPRAAQLLAAAAEGADGPERVRVLADLAIVRFRLDDVAGLVAAATGIADVAHRADPHQAFLADAIGGLAAIVAGDAEEGVRRSVGALDRYRAEPALRDDPRHLVLAVHAAGFTELAPDVVAFLEDRLAHARARGALSVLVPVLAMFSYGRAWLGDHAGAFADAGEAVELAAELGFVADAAPAVEMLAWQHAARGAHDDARALLARAAELVARAGTTTAAAHLALARAGCALCRDDVDEVAAVLEARLAADGGRGARGEILGVAPLLVEAYVASGRREDARALAGRFAAVPPADGRTAALVARCRGLVADDDAESVAAFEAALAAHAAASDAYEQARTALLLGSRLRRGGHRAAARVHLRAARDAFAAMDLTLWAGRATAELAGSGETRRARGPVVEEPLTSQESRVALLVARGLTNREVAAALFLSPKTVEHHLSAVYRKRGLRSRTELARAVADDGPPPVG